MIEVGLMWCRVDGKRSVEETVRAAAKRHVERFGTWPDVGYASPAMLGAGVEKMTVLVGDRKERVVKVFPDSQLAPMHLWLGVEGCESTAGGD